MASIASHLTRVDFMPFGLTSIGLGGQSLENRLGLLLDYGEIGPGGGVWLSSPLFPFLERSGIDAEGAGEFNV